jgi:hypothetical protein
MLQTLPASLEGPHREVAESSGFSLHAGVAAKASQRDKLEHLARYVSRPPVATERLSPTQSGLVRCALKTPYRDGTTHVIFEPEDFIARLAALVPKPCAHLTTHHGVFANDNDRAGSQPGWRPRSAVIRPGSAAPTDSAAGIRLLIRTIRTKRLLRSSGRNSTRPVLLDACTSLGAVCCSDPHHARESFRKERSNAQVQSWVSTRS